MAVDDNVYDLTFYKTIHPGGIPKLLKGAGKDATELFHYHHTYVNHNHIVGKFQIGYLVDKKE